MSHFACIVLALALHSSHIKHGRVLADYAPNCEGQLRDLLILDSRVLSICKPSGETSCGLIATNCHVERLGEMCRANSCVY